MRATKAKEYMKNLMETLSKPWDNKMPSSMTIKRDIENPEDTYVSYISASTPYFLKIISDNFFLQGTGVRVLWVFKSKAEKIKTSHRTLSGSEKRAIQDKIHFIVDLLDRLRNMPKGAIVVPDDVSNVLDKFQTDNHNLAVEIFEKDMFSTSTSYLARMSQNTYKIALIHCLSRYALEPTDKNPTQIVMTMADAEYAMGLTMVYYENYLQMYKAKHILSNEGNFTKSYQADYRRIIFIITSKGGKATFNDIRKATGWKGDDIFDNLAEMIKAGTITKFVEVAGNHKEAEYYRLLAEGEEIPEPQHLPSAPLTSNGKSVSLSELFGAKSQEPTLNS